MCCTISVFWWFIYFCCLQLHYLAANSIFERQSLVSLLVCWEPCLWGLFFMLKDILNRYLATLPLTKEHQQQKWAMLKTRSKNKYKFFESFVWKCCCKDAEFSSSTFKGWLGVADVVTDVTGNVSFDDPPGAQRKIDPLMIAMRCSSFLDKFLDSIFIECQLVLYSTSKTEDATGWGVMSTGHDLCFSWGRCGCHQQRRSNTYYGCHLTGEISSFMLSQLPRLPMATGNNPFQC